MKRIAPLVSFSHDHHHALSQARRLVRASSAGAEGRVDASRAFLDFYRTELIDHFHDEEQQLFPCAIDVNDRELDRSIARALADHDAIRARADQLRSTVDAGESPDATHLRSLGELVATHVRHEERVVFELLQGAVDEHEIGARIERR